MKRIAFTTLGCKANQYDTECMIDACRRAGFAIVAVGDTADAYVINTCTVTSLADAQGRNLLRRARRRAPKALVIAVGCSAQNDADTYRAMPEVDHVLGVRCVEEVIRFLEGEVSPQVTPLDQSRARALLKIQDGCDKRCTYCAVWRARGAPTSVELHDAISSYRALSAYPEVMLTGIHIGQYGRDLDPSASLWELLDGLVHEDEGPRIRLSSLDPDEYDERMIAFLSHPRLCRHVHLSVQSGSPRVLESMGRAYRPDDVRRAVESLAAGVPGIGIGMDLIAGFPGETDADHASTRALVRELPLAFLHVFPFSPRPGTAAADLPDVVPVQVRKRRASELIELGKGKKEEFVQHQMGQEVEAVVISRGPDDRGLVRAVTDNYLTVHTHGNAADYGTAMRVRITDVIHKEVHAR